MVSSFDPDFVKSMFLEPYSNVHEAIDAAMEALPDGKVLVMPYGGSTLPRE